MDKPLSSILGAAVRTARVRAGLTQEDVAERIGMASEVYGRMERGQMLPRVENLRRLCLVLNVPPHELLGLESMAPGKGELPGRRGDALGRLGGHAAAAAADAPAQRQSGEAAEPDCRSDDEQGPVQAGRRPSPRMRRAGASPA